MAESNLAGTVRGGRSTAASIAGVFLALAGFIVLMGVTTAESLYDTVYTTHDNEISDLGATVPPDSVIYQPSAAIFNGTMLGAGACIIVSTVLLHRTGNARRFVIPTLLLGVGAFGVGVFPGNRAPMHALFALLAFSAGGVAAVLGASQFPSPFRYCSAALGIIALGGLVIGMFGSETRIYSELGDGGIERWIAYPVVIWLVATGGFFMNPHSPRRQVAK